MCGRMIKNISRNMKTLVSISWVYPVGRVRAFEVGNLILLGALDCGLGERPLVRPKVANRAQKFYIGAINNSWKFESILMNFHRSRSIWMQKWVTDKIFGRTLYIWILRKATKELNCKNLKFQARYKILTHTLFMMRVMSCKEYNKHKKSISYCLECSKFNFFFLLWSKKSKPAVYYNICIFIAYRFYFQVIWIKKLLFTSLARQITAHLFYVQKT